MILEWGRGLQKGAVGGLKQVMELLNQNKEQVKYLGQLFNEAGNKFSTYVVEKVKEASKVLVDLSNNPLFKNANLLGKIKMAWDEIIEKPFFGWWNGGGKDKIMDALSKVGKSIGGGIRDFMGGIFDALAGINSNKYTTAGVEAGSIFFKSFMEALKPQIIVKKFVDALGGLTKDTFSGSETSGASGLLLTLMLAKSGLGGLALKGAGKAGGGLMGLLRGAGGAESAAVGATATGSTGALGGAVAALASPAGSAVLAIAAVGTAVWATNEAIKEHQQMLINYGDTLKQSTDAYLEAKDKVKQFTDMKKDFDELQKKIADVNTPAKELNGYIEKRKDLIKQLNEIYPSFNANSTTETADLEKKLGVIKEQVEQQKELARLKAQITVSEGMGNLSETYKLMNDRLNKSTEFKALYGKTMQKASAVGEYKQKADDIRNSKNLTDQQKVTELGTLNQSDYGNKIAKLMGIMPEQLSMMGSRGFGDAVKEFYKQATDYSNQEKINYEEYIKAQQAIQSLRDNSAFLEKDGLLNKMESFGVTGTYEDLMQKYTEGKLTGEQAQAVTDFLTKLKDINEQFSNMGIKPIDIQYNINIVTSTKEAVDDYTKIFSQYKPHPHALGGLFTKPHMGLVAEAGAEAIIPLSPSKRDRGLSLWQQAGRHLGVTPYADGGIVGAVSPRAMARGINLSVSVNNSFAVEGDGTGVVDKIKAQIRGMADDISEEIAIRLEKVYANMPV